MFIVLLRFSDNHAKAPEFMAGHNTWLKQGFDDGVFLLAGTVEPDKGGCILAQEESMEVLVKRIKEDPFVAENVVTANIMRVTPQKTDERLAFLA